MRYAVMVKVDGMWSRLVVTPDYATAQTVAGTVRAAGKMVRVIPF